MRGCGVGLLLAVVAVDARAQDRGAPPPVARFDDGAPPAAPSASGAPAATTGAPPATAAPGTSTPASPAPLATNTAPPQEAAPTSALPVVAAPPTIGEAPRVVQEPMPEAEPDGRFVPPRRQRRWYGWQTLLVDVPSFAMWIGGAAASPQNGTLAGVGFAGYLIGAPIVHAAHGHWGKFGASLGFRAGTVLVAAAGAIGCLSEGLFSERECSPVYVALVYIGAAGVLAAVAVDAAVIAREDVEPERRYGIGVAPWVAKDGRGGGLTLGGAF